MIARILGAVAVIGAGVAAADPPVRTAAPTVATADAPTPTAAPAPARVMIEHPDSDAAAPSPRGFALGVELGEPVSATVGWFTGPVLIAGAIGTGTFGGPGLSLHADGQVAVAHLAEQVPLRVGIGVRYDHHGYRPASLDEIPHSHYGIRGSVAIAWQRPSMELYVEASPGVDVIRTTSCTLGSGPNSICPHAMESPLFLQLVLGARWFLSH